MFICIYICLYRVSVSIWVSNDFKMSGDLNMSSTGRIGNLVEPVAAQDAATKAYVDKSIPIGGIIMWSGANDTWPSNWKLCNGSNGTPDLRGRFVLGNGSGTGLTPRTTGQTSGSETVKLLETHMPKHKHNVSAVAQDNGTHTHSIYHLTQSYYQSNYEGNYSGYNGFTTSNTSAAGSHSHTITVTESEKGSDTAHENMPPFYVLAFIMRIS